MGTRWVRPVAGAAVAMGLLVPTAANAVPLAGPVAATQKKAAKLQRPTTTVPLPYRLHDTGRTLLLGKKVRTNAGQAVKVMVKVRNVSANPAKRATPKQAKVIRKNGKVKVWLSGTVDPKVIVTLSAPAKSTYGKYEHRVVYDSRDDALSGFGSWLFKNLVKSAGKQIGKELAGWAMASLGLAGDDKTAQISAQIAELSKQLDAISRQIEALKAEIETGFCQGQTTAASHALAIIDTAQQQYRTRVDAKDTDLPNMVDWANRYVLTSDGVQTALNDIDKVLQGSAGTTGAIGQCAKAMLNSWKQPLAEDAYYQDVYNYFAYFQQYQILASNLLAEANHVMALNDAVASGKSLPTDPADTPTICQDVSGKKKLKNLRSYCLAANQGINLVYWNLVEQAIDAGAAYAWNVHADGVSLAAQKGTSLVWVTDLNTYGDTRGCDKPLNSTKNACGPTVGSTDPLADWDRMGYPTWQVANAQQWTALLQATTMRGKSLADILVEAGMSRTDKIIFYTGEAFTTAQDAGFRWMPDKGYSYMQLAQADAQALCMSDTNFTYSDPMGLFCKDGYLFRNLIPVYNQFRSDKVLYYEWFTNPAGFPRGDLYPDPMGAGSNSDYYDGEIRGRRLDSNKTPWIQKWAGWINGSGAQQSATPQYRWPVLKAPTGTVDNRVPGCVSIAGDGKPIQLQPYNAAGQLSMCGRDFVAWLKSWMPDPASGSLDVR